MSNVDIHNAIYDAVYNAVPTLLQKKFQDIQAALNRQIDYEINNDIALQPGRKYLPELNLQGAYSVQYNYNGGMEGSITISIDNEVSEDARSYLSSAIYQAKQYVLG